MEPAKLLLKTRWQSHVRNFENEYASGPSKYWHGPDLKVTGQDGRFILKRAHKWVCEEWCSTSGSQPIDMVGHSRGGHIVVELARLLKDEGCCCDEVDIKPVEVRFLGLYDPVDMTAFFGKETIPDNVKFVADVQAKPFKGNLSRPTFNRVNDGPENSSATKRWVKGVPGTHSAIGGAPGQGDKPTGFDRKNDNTQAIRADEFIRRKAREVGVSIPMVADYGFIGGHNVWRPL